MFLQGMTAARSPEVAKFLDDSCCHVVTGSEQECHSLKLTQVSRSGQHVAHWLRGWDGE